MTVINILHGLEDVPGTGAEAEGMARLGFLEWVFARPGIVTPDCARRALDDIAAHAPESEAACAFVGFLKEAACVMGGPRGRRGRAPRHLH